MRVVEQGIRFTAFEFIAALIVASVASPLLAVDAITGLTAKAAIVVDNSTGRVLFARNADWRLPNASTTKILTAYLALRSGRPYDHFVVSRNASQAEPSKLGLQPGWRMKVEDLIYAILLNSANDASVVLAEGLAGSVPAFAKQMTAIAHEMGAKNSRFLNPSGLPQEGHYSTAYDLATMMRHALQLPELRQVLSTRTMVIQPHGSKRKLFLRSHNRLLGQRDIEVIGKTGYTRAAKRCFVGAARQGDREIVIALLGASDLWGDARRLIDYGLERLRLEQTGPSEQEWEEALDPQPIVEILQAASVPAEAVKAPPTEIKQPARAPAAKSAVSGTAQRKDPEAEEYGSRRYQVRLASFRSLHRAKNLKQLIERRGYNVVVQQLVSEGEPMFRVVVLGFSTRSAAAKAAEKLSKIYRIEPKVVALGA